MSESFLIQVGEKVNEIFPNADAELSETEKAVVLIRVAVEKSIEEVGAASAIHMLSTIMTITLEIMADEESLSSVDPLVGFDIDGLVAN